MVSLLSVLVTLVLCVPLTSSLVWTGSGADSLFSDDLSAKKSHLVVTKPIKTQAEKVKIDLKMLRKGNPYNYQIVYKSIMV